MPVLLPPVPGIADAVAGLDALVLSGGADIDPAAYGAAPHPLTGPVEPGRDAAEFALLAAAAGRGLPVLAICRGLQILNVSRGGTLHQHLPDLVAHDSHRSAPGLLRRRTRCGSPRTAGSARCSARPAAGGELRLTVPTSHHQAIDRLGDGLVRGRLGRRRHHRGRGARPGPRPGRGREPGREQFLLAVQWHPEAGDDPRLFQALVAAARAYRDAGPGGQRGAGRRQPLDSRA